MHAQVQDAVDRGATLRCGGRIPDGVGAFYPATVLADCGSAMRVMCEETFGPVAPVIVFDTEEEAVEIANDILYGLAAGVWTESIRRAINVSNRLRAGTVWVNTYRAVSFMSPFGGYKRSGIGRENGAEAINEYLQTKSVWISTETEVPNPFVMR